MSKKFYLISLLFYFCALFYECAELVKAVSDICFRYGITAKMQMLYFGGGANQTKK